MQHQTAQTQSLTVESRGRDRFDRSSFWSMGSSYQAGHCKPVNQRAPTRNTSLVSDIMLHWRGDDLTSTQISAVMQKYHCACLTGCQMSKVSGELCQLAPWWLSKKVLGQFSQEINHLLPVRPQWATWYESKPGVSQSWPITTNCG